MTGESFEQKRRVADVFGHRSDLIHRRSERDDAVAAHPAIGRFETDDAAAGRRLADGSAGVGSQGGEALIGSHRGSRSSRRAAGNAR